MKKQKLRKKVQNEIFKSIWIGENSIMASENDTEYTLRRLDFETKFYDCFENTEYISKYFDKGLTHIMQHFWRSGEQLTTNPAECK